MEILIVIFIICILLAWINQKLKFLRNKKGEIGLENKNLEINSSLSLSPDPEINDTNAETQSSSSTTLFNEPTWFTDFEYFISECLKLSLANAKITAELVNNPKLNEIYSQLRENNVAAQEAQRLTKPGIETGRTSSDDAESFKRHLLKNYPKKLSLSLDEAKNALSRERYAEELKNYNDFVGVTLLKLKSQQFAEQKFVEILRNVGMEEILAQHFLSVASAENK